jgi:hypothetical protein
MQTATVRDKPREDETKSLDQRLQRLQPATRAKRQTSSASTTSSPAPDYLCLERLARNVPKELLIERMAPRPPPVTQFCSGTNPKAPTVYIRPRLVFPEVPTGRLGGSQQQQRRRQSANTTTAVDVDDDDDVGDD